MEEKDLKGFEYIGDLPAYNKTLADKEQLPLYVKVVGGIMFFATETTKGLEPVVRVEQAKIETYNKGDFTYNAICKDSLFLMLPNF